MATYGITDASQIIDYDTIKSGCAKLRQTAVDFREAASSIEKAGKDCTAKVISVDSKSFEEPILQLGVNTLAKEDAINQYADSIDKTAYQVYSEQKAELEEYQRKLREANKR